MLITLFVGMILGTVAGTASWLAAAAYTEVQRTTNVARLRVAGAEAWTAAEAEAAGYGPELNVPPYVEASRPAASARSSTRVFRRTARSTKLKEAQVFGAKPASRSDTSRLTRN